MSDIEAWLDEHEGALAELARELDVGDSLVHVAAVFVLAGMRDAEIHQQLQELLRWLDGRTDPFADAQHALEAVRQLVSRR